MGNEIVDHSDIVGASPVDYILIIGLTPRLNRLGKHNCNTRRQSFKFWNFVSYVRDWFYGSHLYKNDGGCRIRKLSTKQILVVKYCVDLQTWNHRLLLAKEVKTHIVLSMPILAMLIFVRKMCTYILIYFHFFPFAITKLTRTVEILPCGRQGTIIIYIFYLDYWCPGERRKYDISTNSIGLDKSIGTSLTNACHDIKKQYSLSAVKYIWHCNIDKFCISQFIRWVCYIIQHILPSHSGYLLR